LFLGHKKALISFSAFVSEVMA